MTQTLPAIIPNSKAQLEEEMKLVSGFAPLVQVDIADGVFAPKKTWPYNEVDTDFFDALKKEDVGWPEWERTDVELHMMVTNPEETVLDWIQTGITSVVAHVEATDNFQKVIDLCREHDVSVGIAFKPSTDLSKLAPFALQVDFIQCMGSDKIGSHGVPLDALAVERITALRALYPERIISIDIGVTEESAQMLVNAGATKLIVGSAIIHADNPKEVYKYLLNIEKE